MTIDIGSADNVHIRLPGSGYKVKLIEHRGATYYFHIIGDTCRGTSCIDKKAFMFLSSQGRFFFCKGSAFCTNPHRIVFVAKTPFLQDKRTELRFEVPLLPGKIEYFGLLHNYMEARVSILDLSKSGISFETHQLIRAAKKYHLQIGLGLINSPDFIVHLPTKEAHCITHVKILQSREIQDTYVLNAVFTQLSREYKHTLGHFIGILEKEIFEG